MLAKAALSILLVGREVSGAPTNSPSSTPTSAAFNIASPASTPAHVPPPSPSYLPAAAVDVILASLSSNIAARSLDYVVKVDDIFLDPSMNSSSILLPRAATSGCLDSTTNDTVINSLFYYGGAGTVVSLCPGATINIAGAIFFTAANQELSTQGYPTDTSRATIVVNGPLQSAAIYGPCDLCQNVALRNIQINGNRAGLGWMSNGLALIEMGGNTANQTIDNCHVYEPRGWSCLHGIEGYANSCRNMVVSNNQIGPSGHAPNTGLQFRKRDNTGNYSPGEWADGISMACQQSFVTNNVVTDATDGAIVCFTCASAISGNTVISNNRQLLGGINMVDYGPNNGIYTGTTVTGNTIIAQNNFIKVGIAVGTMTWGSDNRTASRLTGGSISGNILLSGTNGYFGFGVSVGGHTNVALSPTLAAGVNFGGEPSNVCFSTLIPVSQDFVIDPTNTPGSTFGPEFNQTNVAFMICQEPGPIVAVGTVSTIINQVTPTGAAMTVPGGDLALNAIATASSYATNQPPSAANDGIIGGYTPQGGDYTKEWSSNGSRTNAWLLLTWQAPIMMSSVALYDRPNLMDYVTGGSLTFDDGSVVQVPALVNDGSALIVTFAPRSSATLLFTILSASSFTTNSGLSEIAVFGPTTAPISAAASTVSVTLASVSSAVTSSVASTSLPLSSSQVLTSTSSSTTASLLSTIAAVTLTTSTLLSSLSSSTSSPSSSSSPTSTSSIDVSSTSSKASSTLSSSTLVVATLTTLTTSMTSSITVTQMMTPIPVTVTSTAAAITSSASPIPTFFPNLALAANVVSSTSSAGNAKPALVRDGLLTTQWIGTTSNGNGVNFMGQTLTFTWSTPQTFNQVIFSPGSTNGIKSATLSFANSPDRIQIGALNVSGSTVYSNFTTRTTKSMTFTILTTNSGAKSVGLAEIQIFNNPTSIIRLVVPLTSTARAVFANLVAPISSTSSVSSSTLPATPSSIVSAALNPKAKIISPRVVQPQKQK